VCVCVCVKEDPDEFLGQVGTPPPCEMQAVRMYYMRDVSYRKGGRDPHVEIRCTGDAAMPTLNETYTLQKTDRYSGEMHTVRYTL